MGFYEEWPKFHLEPDMLGGKRAVPFVGARQEAILMVPTLASESFAERLAFWPSLAQKGFFAA